MTGTRDDGGGRINHGSPMTTPKPASAPQADKWKALEANLAERYLVCSDAAATPSSILLAVLNAVAEVNDASAQVREAEPTDWKWWNGTGYDYGNRPPVTRHDARPLYSQPPKPAAEPAPATINSSEIDSKLIVEPVPVAQEIARFDFTEGGFEDENERGHYVRYADHARRDAALKAEIHAFWIQRNDAIGRAHELEALLAAYRAELQEMADHGLRFDLNPTHDASNAEEFWHGYIRQADRSIRERAAAVLPLAGEVANG